MLFPIENEKEKTQEYDCTDTTQGVFIVYAVSFNQRWLIINKGSGMPMTMLYVNPNTTLHEDEAISHKKCTIDAIQSIFGRILSWKI